MHCDLRRGGGGGRTSGGDNAWSDETRQNGVPCAKRLHAPVRHDQDLVHGGENVNLVGDDHDCRAHRLEFLDGCKKGLFAGGVEIGVGLVENNQTGIAVERSCEPNSLALTARKGLPTFANLRVIAMREALDEIMAARQLGGKNDGLSIDLLESRDILRHCSREELNVLRQIADMPAELLGIPMRKIGAVEPHGAAQDWPNADQNARENSIFRLRLDRRRQ